MSSSSSGVDQSAHGKGGCGAATRVHIEGGEGRVTKIRHRLEFTWRGTEIGVHTDRRLGDQDSAQQPLDRGRKRKLEQQLCALMLLTPAASRSALLESTASRRGVCLNIH